MKLPTRQNPNKVPSFFPFFFQTNVKQETTNQPKHLKIIKRLNKLPNNLNIQKKKKLPNPFKRSADTTETFHQTPVA